MTGLSLALGLLLPWLLGIAVLLALRDRDAPLDRAGELAWIVGAGYPAGAVLLTLWMRALSVTGVRFGVASIALPLVVVTAVLAYHAWSRHGGVAVPALLRRAAVPDTPAAVAARAVWWGLLAWVVLRFVLLGLEVAWRPIYPWGAWISWAPKARVWFELGRMAPFVDAAAWYAANGAAWFDAGPTNPATLPLLQVWACISLGSWDDALMNWPWWQSAVALTLVVYGGLRRLGTTALEALVAAYLVASLPLANIHVALAGYPDLPLAAVYAVAALALLHWSSYRTLRGAVVVVLFAAACPLIRNGGALLASTLLPGVVIAAWPHRGVRITLGAFGLIVFGIAVLAQTQFTIAGRPLHLDFAPVWQDLADSLFILGNWNLLWYGVIGAMLLAWRALLQPPLLTVTAIVAGTLLLAAFVFAFPESARPIADLPGLTRTTLQFAPLLVVFLLLAFRAFAARFAAPPTPDATPAAAHPATVVAGAAAEVPGPAAASAATPA